jgi:hypothetical protein
MSVSWFFDELEIDDSFVIKVNGSNSSVEEVKKLAGQSFMLNCSDNFIEFQNQGDSLTLTINNSECVKLSGGVHLNINPMAVCIGDQCMMWPDLPESKNAEASVILESTGNLNNNNNNNHSVITNITNTADWERVCLFLLHY